MAKSGSKGKGSAHAATKKSFGQRTEFAPFAKMKISTHGIKGGKKK